VRINQLTTTRCLSVGRDQPVNADHGLFAEVIKLLKSVLVADDDLRKTTTVANEQE
jgi:hypothetical protein